MNYQVFDNVNDRGPARMLGCVLILVMGAVILTAVAVIGGVNALQDAADARRTDAYTEHQQDLWAGESAVASQPSMVAAQADFAAAQLRAQGIREEGQAQAQAIKDVADAKAYAAGEEEKTRVQKVRDDQKLEREKNFGLAAVCVGALAAAMLVLVAGVAALRLVDRLLPPRPPLAPQPQAASQLQLPRPAPAAPQPKRQPLAPAPAPLMFTADDSGRRRPAAPPKSQRAIPPRRPMATQ